MRWTSLPALLAAGVVLAILLQVTSHLGAPRSPGNVAASATVRVEGAVGVPAWILRGPRPPDGGELPQERLLVLGEQTGVLELAFGEDTRIRGLLLQADADDRYRLEGRVHDGDWRRIGALGAVGSNGLRTRTLDLEELPPLRGLRIRAVAPGVSIVSAVRAYEVLPDGWPVVAPESLAGSWPVLRNLTAFLALRLGIALLGLVGAVVFWRGRPGAPPRRAARILLATAGVLALFSGWDFFQYARPLGYLWSVQNPWDVYHYYLGARYAPELGYTELYRCTLAADFEAGLGTFRGSGGDMRDLGSNRLVPVAVEAAGVGQCSARFAPDRWQAFTRDVAWFRTQLPPEGWIALARDHGYNPSPAWAVVGRPIAEAVSLQGHGFAVLMGLDTVLLVLLWGIVWRTFGLPAASIGLVFYGTNYAAGHWWTHGAFLRYGWLFLTVIGLCSLRLGRPVAGGFLVAWATLLRVFPAFLVIGVALRAAVDVATTRTLRLSRERWRFVAGGLAAVVAIGGLSLMATGRADSWQGFLRNTRKHYDVTALNTMGALAVTGRIEAGLGLPQGPAQRGKEPTPGSAARAMRLALAVAVAPLLLLAIRREPDWSAAILATAWIPFVTELGSYYYVLLSLSAFLIPRRRVVAVGLTALSAVLAAIGLWDHFGNVRETFVMSSACILAFNVWLLALFALSPPGKADATG